MSASDKATEVWEAAYLRFETPEEEIAKFTRRLLQLGARQWPRDAAVVELFCWPPERFASLGLRVEEWRSDLRLYPWFADWLFGRQLHLLARLTPEGPA